MKQEGEAKTFSIFLMLRAEQYSVVDGWKGFLSQINGPWPFGHQALRISCQIALSHNLLKETVKSG